MSVAQGPKDSMEYRIAFKQNGEAAAAHAAARHTAVMVIGTGQNSLLFHSSGGLLYSRMQHIVA